MPHLYILQSLKNSSYYIGSTSDLQRRLEEHNAGLSRYTRPNLPYKLVFQQEFAILKDARTVEMKLKSYKSRKIIERIVHDQLLKITAG